MTRKVSWHSAVIAKSSSVSAADTSPETASNISDAAAVQPPPLRLLRRLLHRQRLAPEVKKEASARSKKKRWKMADAEGKSDASTTASRTNGKHDEKVEKVEKRLLIKHDGDFIFDYFYPR